MSNGEWEKKKRRSVDSTVNEKSISSRKNQQMVVCTVCTPVCLHMLFRKQTDHASLTCRSLFPIDGSMKVHRQIGKLLENLQINPRLIVDTSVRYIYIYIYICISGIYRLPRLNITWPAFLTVLFILLTIFLFFSWFWNVFYFICGKYCVRQLYKYMYYISLVEYINESLMLN